MYSIQFNGRKERDYNLLVKERPAIPAPVIDSSAYTVPGRDGELYEYPGTVSDITIPITFGYVCKPEEWQETFRNARRWLLSRNDMKLYFDDSKGFHYRVKKVNLGESAREYKAFGEFTAEFVCEGYQYDDGGMRAVSPEEAKYNPYDLCHPDYIIKGDGDCTLTVNGKTLEAVVTENLMINTDLMLSYRIDGTMQNTAITGDYEDLYLNPGENTIRITDGFTLQVVPHWRSL